MKITLANNWRQIHKKGTVIFASFCAAITAFGPSIIDAWSALPSDLKAWLPRDWGRYLAIAAFLLTVVIRYTSIRGKDREVRDAAS